MDAVGFDANGDHSGGEAGATVLNSLMDSTRLVEPWEIPGLYVTDDPGGGDEAAKGYAEFDTGAGVALLEQARIELAEFDKRPPAPAAPAGGKAKAAKGTGRAPIRRRAPRGSPRRTWQACSLPRHSSCRAR